MPHSIERVVHTMAFVTPVIDHWLEQDYLSFKEVYLKNNATPAANLRKSQ